LGSYVLYILKDMAAGVKILYQLVVNKISIAIVDFKLSPKLLARV
jgi:hypothetical protein